MQNKTYVVSKPNLVFQAAVIIINPQNTKFRKEKYSLKNSKLNSGKMGE